MQPLHACAPTHPHLRLPCRRKRTAAGRAPEAAELTLQDVGAPSPVAAETRSAPETTAKSRSSKVVPASLLEGSGGTDSDEEADHGLDASGVLTAELFAQRQAYKMRHKRETEEQLRAANPYRVGMLLRCYSTQQEHAHVKGALMRIVKAGDVGDGGRLLPVVLAGVVPDLASASLPTRTHAWRRWRRFGQCGRTACMVVCQRLHNSCALVRAAGAARRHRHGQSGDAPPQAVAEASRLSQGRQRGRE